MREPIVLNWAGGEHPFLLRIGEMIALEKACGSGIAPVFARLRSSLTGAPTWHVADITETLRLGMIGGGIPRQEAQEIVSVTVDRVGLMALAPTAMSVLFASLKSDGDEEEDDGDTADSKQKKKVTRQP
ncbi:gene transfer agent family protein [Paracoccus sp. SSK6]|uniref:gene transfer agent family protein n=1 Tax=Paracoccus sp. SSK6 TaxID=3143131 RepID=UPI0032190E8B